jgi:hypothetical protein
LTCRTRKVKCDEVRPKCTRCIAHGFSCDWPVTTGNAVAGHAGRVPQPSRSSQLKPNSMHLREIRRATNHQPILLGAPVAMLQLECSNSLVVTSEDRRLWQFFPSTNFFLLYDFGECSPLRSLFEKLAPSNSTVMSMVLAISASEMRSRGLLTKENSFNHGVDLGIHHYGLALKQLQSSLGRSTRTKAGQGVEYLVASVFLMINYETLFPTSTSTDRVRTHLEGLWALISTHPLFQLIPGTSPAPEYAEESTAAGNLSLSCHMVLWCLYVHCIVTILWLLTLTLLRYLDISMACTGACGSLLSRLTSSTDPLFDCSRLCAVARRSNPRLWGEDYLPEQRLRDMEACRPMEFGVDVTLLRFRVCDLRQSGRMGYDDGSVKSSLQHQLLLLKEVSPLRVT